MLHKYSVCFVYEHKVHQITVSASAWYQAYSKSRWMQEHYDLQVKKIYQLADED